MTNLVVKALLLLLAAILMAYTYIDWFKVNKERKSGIVKIVMSIVFICFFVYVELFQTTMFEFLLGFALAFLLFAFRKSVRMLYIKLCDKKLGKIKIAGILLMCPVAFWLVLALFYQTPLGKPIGVRNYLYHKYDEEFEIGGIWAENNYGRPINGFICWPKNGRRATDAFRVEKKRTLSVGSKLFASDNYYGIIIREDYENRIADVINDYFEEFKIFACFDYSGISTIVYMSDYLSKDTTLEEFIEYQSDKNTRSSHNTASVDVFLPKELVTDKESTLQKIDMIAKELEHKIPYLTIDFGIISDDSNHDYESLNHNTFLSWKNQAKQGPGTNYAYSTWRPAYLIYDYEAVLSYKDISERLWDEPEE